MPFPVSLTGAVERVGDKLILRIPLSVGGSELIACSRGIATVEEGLLHVDIPPWLATQLAISEGSLVTVDNHSGKFSIRAANPRNA